MKDKYTVKVKVEGDFACFTRPDLKVERMTYPCMTPSSARGILDSIFWKPEFKCHIKRIYVLNPIKFYSIKRNEIKIKQRKKPIIIEAKRSRSQRNSIILKNVSYIIEASVYLDNYSEKNPPLKYVEQFNRRVNKGQCFRRPYLGCREFSAEFNKPKGTEKPISETIPIGNMFLDMFYNEKGDITPLFFYDVSVKKGILDCEEEYEQILKSHHIKPEIDTETAAKIAGLYKRGE